MCKFICQANQHSVEQRHHDHAAHNRTYRISCLPKISIPALPQLIVNELRNASGQRLSTSIEEKQPENRNDDDDRVAQDKLPKRPCPAEERRGICAVQPAGDSTGGGQYCIPLIEQPGTCEWYCRQPIRGREPAIFRNNNVVCPRLHLPRNRGKGEYKWAEHEERDKCSEK
jgi:hypothetical protein